FGAAEERDVGPGPGGVDELAGCVAALPGRSEVERAPIDLLPDRCDRLVSSLGGPAHERQITAGRQEPSSRARDTPGAGDGGHLEVVTQDEAGEAETSPKQTADHLSRKRRREHRVERAVPNVPDHHRRAAGSEGGAEWNEIPALQLVQSCINVRQGEMRVDRGASVPRKVLGDGNKSLGE